MNVVNWDLNIGIDHCPKKSNIVDIVYKNWESMGYVNEVWQSVCMRFTRVQSISHSFKNVI